MQLSLHFMPGKDRGVTFKKNPIFCSLQLCLGQVRTYLKDTK